MRALGFNAFNPVGEGFTAELLTEGIGVFIAFTDVARLTTQHEVTDIFGAALRAGDDMVDDE